MVAKVLYRRRNVENKDWGLQVIVYDSHLFFKYLSLMRLNILHSENYC